jgi:triacylglycerol lipase
METPRHAPIVLVHGLLGFDRIAMGRFELKRYFPGIEEQLQTVGRRVRVARLSRTRGVAARALELRRYIRGQFPGERVHIFAHSMGGLDARWMISKLDMAEHVLSLTTIGTPHRGSSFADWGIRKLHWCLGPIMRMLSISPDAFYDLTTENCRRFNDDVKDMPGVRYYSIAGQCERNILGPFWHLPWRIVYDREGPNDGVVSVNSARYGEHCDVWEGDHLNLVNWRSRSGLGRDYSSNYLGMANRLAY